jgi:NAD(P)-dependent dehydrogenase (short-subunit alcohol dehydrogenase family)
VSPHLRSLLVQIFIFYFTFSAYIYGFALFAERRFTYSGTAGHTKGNGGYGPAQAAKEALTRDLSLEFAPQGLRGVCLRPHGIPETSTMKEVFEKGKAAGMTWEHFTEYLASTTHPKRVMTLNEMANVAAFVASDKASGLTGTIVNLTMGSLDD